MTTLAETIDALDLPKRPKNANDLDQLSLAGLNWITQNVPYYSGGSIYRPELVKRKGLKEANCFAQAIAGVALFNYWELNAGVVYDNTHASIAVTDGVKVIFVDPGNYKSDQDFKDDAGHTFGGDNGQMIRNLHQETLTRELSAGNCGRYFYYDTVENCWVTSVGGITRSFTRNEHLIADAQRGVDMLLAIGDLSRYYQNNDPRYEDRYAELSGHLPVFSRLPIPFRPFLEEVQV